MKLSFLCYEPIPILSELDRRMARIAALGYQGIELTASHPRPYPIEEVLALTRKHRLPVVSFLSGWSYANEKLCLNIEERSILETIRGHGRRIRHFHLCETNGGPFGTGNLDFPSVLRTLAAIGYSHFASVKIYRNADWEEAARGAMAFLREECHWVTN